MPEPSSAPRTCSSTSPVTPGVPTGLVGIAPCPLGARANLQLESLFSLQPVHGSLCAGFAAWAAWPRVLANWYEQYYLFSDLWEVRPDGSEKSLPPSLLPSQGCREVLTGLVLCHLCLG